MAESQKENQCSAASPSVGSGSGKRRGGDDDSSSSTMVDLTTTIPSFFAQRQQPQPKRSRTSLVGESPSPGKRKTPPELLTLMMKRQQQHFNGASSQSSGEKTREDVNIHYSKQQHQPTDRNQPAAAMNKNTTTAPIYRKGDSKDDAELEKAIRVSQQQYREEQKRLKDEETAQLEMAMRESIVASSPCVNRQQRQKEKYVVDDDDGVILIDDDDDNNDCDKKLPAKQSLADTDKDKKMPANHINNNSSNNNNTCDNDDDLQKAIRLSLEEANKPRTKPILFDTTNTNDDDETNNEFHCRVLSRNEFEDVIYPLVERNGGFAKIEKGKMVQTGNNSGDVKNSKSQSRAQYGRYMIEDFWKVFDVLEGKVDGMDDGAVNDDEPDGKIDAKSMDDAVDARKQQQEEGQPQNKIGFGPKITALTDIGHGIGLQVMQAGWTLDVDSRGIELMKGRHEIAQGIYDGVIDGLRKDPPDSTKVDLRLDNLVHCVLPPPGKNERDEELRRFVLFQDKPESIQKGLVLFANNAEDVFAARSNDSGNGACLDEHLAELFGNMKVGGRCVTLTDIRCHLTSKDDAKWYHYESFQSGVGAVSWSPNKSVAVHVLTKITNDWMCSNTSNKVPCPPSGVVDEDGRLRTQCLYCLQAPLRKQGRKRKQRKMFCPEDGD